VESTEPLPPFEFAESTESFAVEPPRRRRRFALVLALSIGLPLLAAGGVVGYLAFTGAFAEPESPHLTASQADRIDDEIAEREDLLSQLDGRRSDYRTQLTQWNQSEQWARDFYADAAQPTAAVGNPGGGAMPGDDPYGRAFLDSIGATDVSVFFEAGPENCGYTGSGGGADFAYAGGCFRAEYPNTLYMAWDPQAESVVWPIFVHEAMHWFQDEKYVQATYLAEFAGIDASTYNERWEADASCRAVYVYGMSIDDYVDSSSPCTIDGWYEGWITDYLTSLGAHLTAPDPATFELAETSRP